MNGQQFPAVENAALMFFKKMTEACVYTVPDISVRCNATIDIELGISIVLRST